MEATRKYELLRGGYARFEGAVGARTNVRYKRGDNVELTDAQALALGDRVRLVVPAAKAVAVDPHEEWAKLLAKNAPDVQEFVGASDSLDDLKAIAAAEAAGKSRRGVLNAVEDRVAELEAAAAEGKE